MADDPKSGNDVDAASNITTGRDTGDVYELVTDQLFMELRTVYKETGKVTDEVLSALSNVLQAPLLAALDLVDGRNVTILVSPSGRQLYQVVGSSSTPYTCFPGNCYCSCPAYRFSVLKKEEHVMCKHVLAVRFSNAIGVTKVIEVSNEELTDLLLQLE